MKPAFGFAVAAGYVGFASIVVYFLKRLVKIKIFESPHVAVICEGIYLIVYAH
ncbi:hypothetical protein [Nostoc sp.]|uniref:hypothetical protein n=1 Tax=Nostoc sp. TaxID=1180 RepID=UPI002FFAD801